MTTDTATDETATDNTDHTDKTATDYTDHTDKTATDYTDHTDKTATDSTDHTDKTDTDHTDHTDHADHTDHTDSLMNTINRLRQLLRMVTTVTMVVVLVTCWGAAAAGQAQPPPSPAQEGFVPIDQLQPKEQLPAAPLVMAAYAAAWLVIFGYVWSIWRRLSQVEQEIASLTQRVKGANPR